MLLSRFGAHITVFERSRIKVLLSRFWVLSSCVNNSRPRGPKGPLGWSLDTFCWYYTLFVLSLHIHLFINITGDSLFCESLIKVYWEYNSCWKKVHQGLVVNFRSFYPVVLIIFIQMVTNSHWVDTLLFFGGTTRWFDRYSTCMNLLISQGTVYFLRVLSIFGAHITIVKRSLIKFW